MKVFKDTHAKNLARVGYDPSMAVILPSQIKRMIRIFTSLAVNEAEQQIPPVFALGEADAIYLRPILKIASKVQASIKYKKDGTVDLEAFTVGSVILPLLHMGTVANASVVYILNMKTKNEMEALAQAKASINQFHKDFKNVEGDPKDKTNPLYKKIREMIVDADKLVDWLQKTPESSFSGDPDDVLATDLLKAILEHGGIGFVKQASISAVPEILANRQMVLQLAQTLMNYDKSWMDGYALFLAYQSFAYLTKDASTYDTFFQRVVSPTAAAAASNQARLAQQVGYHFLTLAYAPMSLLYQFNFSLYMSEVDVIRKWTKLTDAEEKKILSAKSDYELYSINFSFNVVKTLHSNIMQALRTLYKTETIISNNLKGLLGDSIQPEKIAIDPDKVWDFITGPVPQVMKEIPYDTSSYTTNLTDLITRLSQTVSLISGALQLSAVAGTELNANALQLPADAIPNAEIDTFSLELLMTPDMDIEKLLTHMDDVSHYTVIPSKIHPFIWKVENEELQYADTILNPYLYKYIRTSTLAQELVKNVLNRPPTFKWPRIGVPISGLSVEPVAKTFIPFNYTRGYEITRLTPKKMRNAMSTFSSMPDGNTRNFIEEDYTILQVADSFTKQAFADGRASIGLYYERIAPDKFSLISPTIPFAYGLHMSVYLANMGLKTVMTLSELKGLVKKGKLNIFKDNSKTISDEPFITEDDLADMNHILIQYSQLPVPSEVLYMNGIMSYAGFFPMPISTKHFTQSHTEGAGEEEKYSTNWLLSVMQKFFLTWNDQLIFTHGLPISKIVKWEPHYGYSSNLAVLPHLTFKVEGGLHSSAVVNELDIPSFFTKHSYISNLPYQKYVISQRPTSLVIFEVEDFEKLKEVKRAQVKVSINKQTKIDASSSNTPKPEADAESILNQFATKNAPPASVKINDAANVSASSSAEERNATHKLEVALESIGHGGSAIIPPSIEESEDKGGKNKSGKMNPGKVTQKETPEDGSFIGNSQDKKKKKNEPLASNMVETDDDTDSEK